VVVVVVVVREIHVPAHAAAHVPAHAAAHAPADAALRLLLRLLSVS
jgi:hypothetical protein